METLRLPHQVEFFTTPHDSVELPPSHLSGFTMHEKSDYDFILADHHVDHESEGVNGDASLQLGWLLMRQDRHGLHKSFVCNVQGQGWLQC